MHCKDCGKHKGHALTCATFRSATTLQIEHAIPKQEALKQESAPRNSAAPEPQRRRAVDMLDDLYSALKRADVSTIH